MILVLMSWLVRLFYVQNTVTGQGIRNLSMVGSTYDPYGAFFEINDLQREAKLYIFIDHMLLIVPVALAIFALINLFGLLENLFKGTNEVLKKHRNHAQVLQPRTKQ